MGEELVYYIIDHSNKLGHLCIFIIKPVAIKFCKLNQIQGRKFEMENGDVIFADEQSSSISKEAIVKIYNNLIKKMQDYIQKDDIEKIDILTEFNQKPEIV